MRRLAETCERIAGTTKKLEKVAIVAEYLKSCSQPEASASALFLSGRPFAMWEETTLQVGGSLLWRVVEELSGTAQELRSAYREHGDLGSVAAAVLPARVPGEDLTVLEVQNRFRQIAKARGPAAKTLLVRELLAQATPLEAKYIIKIMTGDLRIGLKESLVEEAVAKAFEVPLKEVQRANMLLGDISETLRFASEGRLPEATMRLFHPLGFMLASPAASAEEALGYFGHALVEDKYDGIRAQAHCSGDQVRIFSRTRDDITESFPELADALAGFPRDVILDGEIAAWSYLVGEPNETGRALPFSALQKRLGRKKVSQTMMREIPVAYLAFDVLYAGGELLLDRSLRERGKILDELLREKVSHRGTRGNTLREAEQGQFGFTPEITGDFREAEGNAHSIQIIRAPVSQASSPRELDQLFDSAQARGNEGLMIKDPESPYNPGRRGKSWLKLKRELATLDVVVTAVEYGHGKRIGVLSDYTFAVRDEARLVNIGKAYSGLTDVEIAEMTKWFLEHTLEEQGLRLLVEPKIVIEVAFNNMMKSDRHNSGYALRFPRIVRLRPDKPPEEADTLARAEEIFRMQERQQSKT
jgi:ATP-dependent DNA ligase I